MDFQRYFSIKKMILERSILVLFYPYYSILLLYYSFSILIFYLSVIFITKIVLNKNTVCWDILKSADARSFWNFVI